MTVYILYSERTCQFYTGHTQDLENRIMEHNSGETPSIRNGVPWKVVWKTDAANKGEAMILENKIKKRGAKRFLEDQDDESSAWR